MKINWRIRFNKDNVYFVVRFIAAIFIPVLTYFGLEATDLTTWESVSTILADALSNPYVLGMSLINALNMIPDPSTAGLSDDDEVLSMTEVWNARKNK